MKKLVFGVCVCAALLTGCAERDVQEQEPYLLETEQKPAPKQQSEANDTGGNTENTQPEEETEYGLEDVDSLLANADLSGSVTELTETGCRFEKYIIDGQGTIMVSAEGVEPENTEELTVDERTEYVLVKIDSSAGKAVSVEITDSDQLKEAAGIYLYGEQGSDGIWKASKIVIVERQ